MVPLFAYFFLPVESAFVVSLVLSLLVFVGVGVLKGRLAKSGIVVSVIEVLAVGAVSGLGGYFLGTWIPRIFGY